MKMIKETKVVLLSLIMAVFVGVFAGNVTVLAASGDTTVYLTKTGDCYHSGGCSCLRKSKIPTTLQDAVNRGYAPCSKCNPGRLDAAAPATNTTTTNAAAAPTTKSAPASTVAPAKEDPSVEALKSYKGNTKDFNAYTYYKNYPDLQTAIGANGDALLQHYNKSGKAEGRVANTTLTKTSTGKATAKASVTDTAVEALKTYKGNTKDFNAYVYYTKNVDLQTAIGANGDALLKHYNDYGKAEGRVAK